MQARFLIEKNTFPWSNDHFGLISNTVFENHHKCLLIKIEPQFPRKNQIYMIFQIFNFGGIRVQMRIYARNVVKRDFLRDFQTLWDMHSVAIRRIFWHPLIDYCTIWNRDAILQILFDSCW